MKAIEVQHLSKVYPGGIRAVDDISFHVEEGEVWGFLGPNGAEKTIPTRHRRHRPLHPADDGRRLASPP